MFLCRRLMLMRPTHLNITSFKRSHKNSHRKLTDIQKDEILGKIVLNPVIQSTLDVTRLKNMVMNTTLFSPDKIDRSLLIYFIKTKQFKLALDYIRFLDEDTKNKLHLFLINQQFLIYFHKRYSDGILPTSEQELIIELYQTLRKTWTVLNSQMLEYAILALSVTSEWEQCLNLLNDLKKLENPSTICYSAVIAAAFLNKKEHIAWTLLDELFVKGRLPSDVVFSAYFESLKVLSDKKEILLKLDKLFQECSENNFILTNTSIAELGKLLKEFGFIYRVSALNKKGYCANCKGKLDEYELDDNIFDNLRKKVVESVIIGKNVFTKTTPAEFDRFQEFLKSLKGSNVVIDGLNIAYIAGTRQTPEVYATFLAHVVAHFVEKKKKVVVLGRKHMESWPKERWNYIRNNAQIFLTQNISLDDPYLLYCALHCGQDAIVVTRDLMRSHLFLLGDPKYKVMFTRWLEQRQYQVLHIRNDGKVYFKVPRPYTRIVQHNNDYLHIPYGTTEDEVQGSNGAPEKWLCLKTSGIQS